MKRWWIAAAVALLAVVLAVGGVLGFRAVRAREPVVSCGDYQLTNTELAYYYWSEFFYYSGAYGEYLTDMVDFSKPLSEQTYSGDTSWEDYLLEQTLLTIQDTMSMVFQAEAEGYEMSEDYLNTYQQVLVNFAAAAQEGGYADMEDYLRASYGQYADRESFETYLYHSHLAASYADWLLEDCAPTDEACRDYFAENQAYYEEYYDALADDETTWLEQVRQDLQNEEYQNRFLTITNRYEVKVDYDAVRLTPPEGLYES